MKKVTLLILSLFILVACGGVQKKFESGDVVLVDWYQDNWHVAKLVKECGAMGGAENSNSTGDVGVAVEEVSAKSWIVDFNDNFYDASEGNVPGCYSEKIMVLNEAPSSKDLKVGDRVLAEWVEDAYYTAELIRIEGDKYVVKFLADSWEADMVIDKLRIKPI